MSSSKKKKAWKYLKGHLIMSWSSIPTDFVMDFYGFICNSSNCMFVRKICAKLPEYIFENFEIAWVKWGQFQILKKSRE